MFIVETGAGISNANSYVSVEDADTYFADREDPADWTGADTARKEAAIIAATSYLDNKFRLRWSGRRSFEIQALSWPRQNVEDYDGFTLASNALPERLKFAVIEIAVRDITTSIAPDVATEGQNLTFDFNKVGDLETEQRWSSGGKGVQPSFPEAEGLIKDYLISSSATVERC